MCAARGLSTNHTRKKLVARLEKWAWENQPAEVNSRFADWDCLACGTKGNFGSRATCRNSKCKKSNPARRREGDWDCPCCKSLVFAGRNKCFRCGTQNPETATVRFLSEQIPLGKCAKFDKVILKAKRDYVVQQNHEDKRFATLQEFRKQQKAAEKRPAKQQSQVYAASSDSGSMTTDTASVSSLFPMCVRRWFKVRRGENHSDIFVQVGPTISNDKDVCARNGNCLLVTGQKERSRTRLLPPWRRGHLCTSQRWLGIVLRSAALCAGGFQRLRQEATCLRQ